MDTLMHMPSMHMPFIMNTLSSL